MRSGETGAKAYTPEVLRAMADRHDAYSACTMPARDHFAAVCRRLADLEERLAREGDGA